jgi:chromosome segregation ATPase
MFSAQRGIEQRIREIESEGGKNRFNKVFTAINARFHRNSVWDFE